MTDTTATASPAPASPAPVRPRGWLQSIGRWIVIVLVAILVFSVGRCSGANDIEDLRRWNSKLLKQNTELTKDSASKATQVVTLIAELERTKAQLKSIMPRDNTFWIATNQSQNLADGRVTIALIGTPRNESVDLNINSKQQTAAAGEIIDFALDASTTCRLEVISFDVLKSAVLIKATCAPPKP